MNSIEVKSMNVFIELNGIKTFIIGGPSSGKTYLLKKLMNKVNNDDVFINNKNINEYDIDFLKNNIAIVLNDRDFKCEYVEEELHYYLKILNKDINIDSFVKFFEIENLLDEEIAYLKLEDKMFIKILSLLIINPKIFGIDSLIEYLSQKRINLLYQYIKNEGISLINVINNMEYLETDSNIVILNNKTSIYCGNTLYILKGNSILPYMGFKLPFIIDLTQNLVLYDVLNEVKIDKESVVDEIWK